MSGRSMQILLVHFDQAQATQSAYSLSRALISDDLPVPRAPHSNTLLQGFPARNCRTFRVQGRLLPVDPLQIGQPQAVRMPDRPQAAVLSRVAASGMLGRNPSPVPTPTHRQQRLLQPFERGHQPLG
jgi:hypothetical protein